MQGKYPTYFVIALKNLNANFSSNGKENVWFSLFFKLCQRLGLEFHTKQVLYCQLHSSLRNSALQKSKEPQDTQHQRSGGWSPCTLANVGAECQGELLFGDVCRVRTTCNLRLCVYVGGADTLKWGSGNACESQWNYPRGDARNARASSTKGFICSSSRSHVQRVHTCPCQLLLQ